MKKNTRNKRSHRGRILRTLKRRAVALEERLRLLEREVEGKAEIAPLIDMQSQISELNNALNREGSFLSRLFKPGGVIAQNLSFRKNVKTKRNN